MTNNTEITHSTEMGLLFEALSKAQGKIENALKDKKNPFFKSSYADLASVWDACREPLSSNGLAIIQTIEGTKESMCLNTWVGHSSGQWMKSKLPLIVMKSDPQSVGSALTYARRYALSALVGICADEDDDGEKAMGRKNQKEEINNVINSHTPEKEDQLLLEFLTSYHVDNHKMMRTYIEKYSKHHKRSIINSIKDFESDKSKFESEFNNWNKKQISNGPNDKNS